MGEKLTERIKDLYEKGFAISEKVVDRGDITTYVAFGRHDVIMAIENSYINAKMEARVNGEKSPVVVDYNELA